MDQIIPNRPKIARRERRRVQFNRDDCYLDTVEIYVTRVPKGVRAKIERRIGKRPWIINCYDREGDVTGQRVCFNHHDFVAYGKRNPCTKQPSHELLEFIQQLLPAHRIHAVHIACDDPTDTLGEAKAVGDLQVKSLLLKWRRPGPLRTEKTTTYWNSRYANRNLLVYADKPNRRYAGFGDQPRCAHVELRLQNAAALSRAKIWRISDLLRADLPALFAHNVRMVEVNWAAVEQLKLRWFRRSLAHERRHHLERRQRIIYDAWTESFIDNYRDLVKERLQDDLDKRFSSAQSIRDAVIEQSQTQVFRKLSLFINARSPTSMNFDHGRIGSAFSSSLSARSQSPAAVAVPLRRQP